MRVLEAVWLSTLWASLVLGSHAAHRPIRLQLVCPRRFAIVGHMHPLIHDWNATAEPRPPVVMLDDETLRDGLQSPSVRTPTIDEKLRILHLIDALGIDTANIGLPGAGPHVVRDVERLAREIADAAAARDAPIARPGRWRPTSRPIAEISQRVGMAIECCAFIGSSPLRQYAEGWEIDQLLRLTEEAITFAVGEGLPVMYVTEDTTRADPETAAPALFDRGAGRARHACASRDTVGHATPAGAAAWCASSRRWLPTAARRSASTGTAIAIAAST